ncbi:MAG: metallopeptidase TldD-related protein [Candidatus Sericytochromatia bacterium]|nr:metallopeptidase TldD-related protein [Candidatus Sericytochromatia bacterium]
MTEAFTHALAEALAARVATPPVPELALEAWRLTVDAGTSVEVGLKDGNLGGPYDAPNGVTGLRGEAYVRWADGLVSRGVVDRTTPEALDADLRAWRQAAYRDPWAPEVVGPSGLPQVPLWDAGAAAWVAGDTGPMFEILGQLAAELPAYGAERVSGSVTAVEASRTIVTSRGFAHSARSTSVAAWAEVDGRASDGVSARRRPGPEELAGVIRRVGEHGRALQRETALVPGRQTVVLWPSAAEAMWSRYVIGNLDGQRVLHGGGAFTLAQFGAEVAPFHPSLSFGLDPLRPLSTGSYVVSAEGVPARACSFIERGRLVTPLLDLKHARRAELPPTPWPRGASSWVLPAPTGDLEALIGTVERGLLVFQLLGLHTQDAASGRFSLTVSQGLVIERGRLLGRAKAIVAGNFLEALQSPVTWARVAGKDGLALALEMEVTPG